MTKLFALEEETDNLDNSTVLLIDKVLKDSKKAKTPLSLTADLIKQRSELKSEITTQLKDSGEEDDSNKPDDEEKPKEEEEEPSDDKESETKDDKPSDKEEDESDDKSEKDSKDDKDELSEASADKDSLNGLIGSGLKDSPKKEESSPKEDTKETKDEPATESLSYTKSLSNIFRPIHDQYSKYLVSLEAYNVGDKLEIQEQKIVYVKESVLESLNNLIQTADKYIAHNESYISSVSSSVKKLNETITVYKHFVEAKKFHFTNKLVDSKDILSNLSIPGNSDLRTTVKLLLDYIESSSKVINLTLSNDFEKLQDAYTASKFILEGDDYTYTKVLPGFNLIKVHLENYTNYLKTNAQNYQYYKLKVLKTEDLYNLSSIEISKDNDLEFVLENADKLFINVGLYIDNLTTVTENFRKFIDEIKVIIYNIEKNTNQDLTKIGIDDKLKDFIKFKLVIETCYINTDIVVDFVSSVLSVLNLCVELKQ